MSKQNKPITAKLIANPGAGKTGELNTGVKLATRCLGELGVKVDVALAKPKEQATPIAARAVEEGYKTLIAMGGDGTVEAVLRSLVGTKTRLGILPFGTENNIAKSLGIPEKIEDACALIANPTTRKVDVGQIKIKGQDKTYFMELAVIGLAAALYPPANKVLKGELSKLKDAAETILQHESRAKVYMELDDDSRVALRTMLVVVSNTPMFGANFLVAPQASLDDGLLDVTVFPDFSKTELLAYFASVMNEGYSDNPKVQHYRVRKFSLKTKPPLAVNADAVDMGTGNIKIKCLEGALRVIAPEPDDTPNAVVNERLVEMPAPLAPPVTTVEKEAVNSVAGVKK